MCLRRGVVIDRLDIELVSNQVEVAQVGPLVLHLGASNRPWELAERFQ